MAKEDYKDSTVIAGYRSAVGQNSDSKVIVQTASKRDRAELLDAIEDLYQSSVNNGVSAADLRALLHILVKSTDNTLDDDLNALIDTKVDQISGKGLSTNDLTNSRLAEITANTAKVDLTVADAGTVHTNN